MTFLFVVIVVVLFAIAFIVVSGPGPISEDNGIGHPCNSFRYDSHGETLEQKRLMRPMRPMSPSILSEAILEPGMSVDDLPPSDKEQYLRQEARHAKADAWYEKRLAEIEAMPVNVAADEEAVERLLEAAHKRYRSM